MTKNASTPAVGIDLGTTFSVVAYLDASGRPCTIPNAEGDLTTPSVVLFDDSSIVVGKEAVKAAVLEPGKVAQCVKREMGNSFFSKPINGEFLPPEVIQSLILEKLKRDAEVKLGRAEHAVITVPAYFNEPRRKATQDAGRMAGLNVLDIINEPTAAAVAYGVQSGFLTQQGESKQAEKIIVYDLGGGTFDVSFMLIDGKNYQVLATDGDVKLGGVDWDRRIADYIAEKFRSRHGIDPRKEHSGLQRLLREAEDAKRALSVRENVTINFEHAGRGIRVLLTREAFEAMTEDLLERTRFTISNLLRQNHVRWDEITRLLLVGGSSRMPMVARMLEKEAGKPVDRSLSMDEAVAHGAAFYAGLLLASDGKSPQNVKVTNVNSHSLGVLGIERGTGRPRNRVLIPRNTPLPATQTSIFQLLKDNQDDVLVRIIEGGDASGSSSTPIGQCVIRDLPPGLAAGTAVEVTFAYAANGRLTVLARVPGVGRQAQLDIQRASGLSDAKLAEWETRIRNGMRPLKLDL